MRKRGDPAKKPRSWWEWGAQSAQRRGGSTWKVSLSQIVSFWPLPESNVSCLGGRKGKLGSQQGALDLGIGSPNDRSFRMATLGCHTGQSRVGGTSRSENLLQQILIKADMEQSLGGPVEEGAPSPRLPAVVGGEKTAGMRREAAQGQMISSVSDQLGRKTG